VHNGQLARVQPTKPGTFDRAKRNVVLVKLDLLSSVGRRWFAAPSRTGARRP
jgi:hypothetical protein